MSESTNRMARGTFVDREFLELERELEAFRIDRPILLEGRPVTRFSI